LLALVALCLLGGLYYDVDTIDAWAFLLCFIAVPTGITGALF